MMYGGRCSCGAVRYELTDAPMFVHCCHCLDCQRQTGSAFVLNGLIETDRIRVLSGDIVAFPQPTDSGSPHDIYRCAACGTAMWSDYGGRPYLRFVRLGTLEQPATFRPDVHIFTRSKLPWVTLPPDVPAFEIFYPSLQSTWPKEALDRRIAASKAAKTAKA
jgi:hypothetical protein